MAREDLKNARNARVDPSVAPKTREGSWKAPETAKGNNVAAAALKFRLLGATDLGFGRFVLELTIIYTVNRSGGTHLPFGGYKRHGWASHIRHQCYFQSTG
jgi:hypothetical protein